MTQTLPYHVAVRARLCGDRVLPATAGSYKNPTACRSYPCCSQYSQYSSKTTRSSYAHQYSAAQQRSGKLAAGGSVMILVDATNLLHRFYLYYTAGIMLQAVTAAVWALFAIN